MNAVNTETLALAHQSPNVNGSSPCETDKTNTATEGAERSLPTDQHSDNESSSLGAEKTLDRDDHVVDEHQEGDVADNSENQHTKDKIRDRKGRFGRDRFNKDRAPKNPCEVCGKMLFEDEVRAHMKNRHPFQKDVVAAVDMLSTHDGVALALTGEAEGALGKLVASRVPPNNRELYKAATDIYSMLARILKREVDPNLTLFMFGSTVSMGTWDGKGDLDLCVIDIDAFKRGEWPPPLEEEKSLIFRMAAKLRRKYFPFDTVFPIGHSRVPIVKHEKKKAAHNEGRQTDQSGEGCVSKHVMPTMQDVDFDLSARELGIRNSWLIRRYMQQNTVSRVGSVFIKQWSKASGVNDSQHGYLTSYAINIMWIHYLLSSGRVSFVHPVDDVPEASPAKSPQKGTFLPLYDDAFVADPTAGQHDLAKAIYGFFHYYSCVFNWAADVVTISRTARTTKAEMGWAAQSPEAMSADGMCIEDPYEDRNLGKHGPVAREIKGLIALACMRILNGDAEGVLLVSSSAAPAPAAAAAAGGAKKEGHKEGGRGGNGGPQKSQKEKNRGDQPKESLKKESSANLEKDGKSRDTKKRREDNPHKKAVADTGSCEGGLNQGVHVDPTSAIVREASLGEAKPKRDLNEEEKQLVAGICMAASAAVASGKSAKHNNRGSRRQQRESKASQNAEGVIVQDQKGCGSGDIKGDPAHGPIVVETSVATEISEKEKRAQRKTDIAADRKLISSQRRAKMEAKAVAGVTESPESLRKCRHGAQCKTPNCAFKHPSGYKKVLDAAAANSEAQQPNQ